MCIISVFTTLTVPCVKITLYTHLCIRAETNARIAGSINHCVHTHTVELVLCVRVGVCVCVFMCMYMCGSGDGDAANTNRCGSTTVLFSQYLQYHCVAFRFVLLRRWGACRCSFFHPGMCLETSNYDVCEFALRTRYVRIFLRGEKTEKPTTGKRRRERATKKQWAFVFIRSASAQITLYVRRATKIACRAECIYFDIGHTHRTNQHPSDVRSFEIMKFLDAMHQQCIENEAVHAERIRHRSYEHTAPL